ncbi:MAG TPA: ferric reductase-like transmembrane domain-containing protein [Pseudonocardia sp.]|nr:ferric reductase-like transmembrane domain-containing protein [Pseudonocardia sp.]
MDLALWFASRATGLVALPLLTVSLVLGIIGAGRGASERWPRFTVAALHRNIAMMSVLFLAVHVSTAIIDPYAGIGWLDAVLPFGSVYRPFWLGLGSVALDLMLAVLVTSLLRPRISLRLWRAVHWAGYGCWPIAVAHGLGIGGRDSGLGWVLSLNVSCVAIVLVALYCRLRGGRHPDSAARRAATLGGR